MTSVQSKTTHSVREYIASLKESRKYGPQVVFHKIFNETGPIYSKDLNLVSEKLRNNLIRKGIPHLYDHQGKSIAAVQNSKNVIIATPTSSGKSMVYNIPVLESIIQNPQAHALYIFPLKALSQDQCRSIHEFTAALNSVEKCLPESIAAIYDGDTSPYARRKIREDTPPIVITTPEMLHLSFLPFHENWSGFFQNLQYIVIDEVHIYRGILGSHICWLLRRLRRVLDSYGSKPVFILSSATIGNPAQFSQSLIGEEFFTVTETGAPQSKKNFLFLNPWDSPAYMASQLLEAALKRGLRTIVYTKSRKMTELISLWTRPKLGHLAHKLNSYRAGFLPEERRKIEQQLNDGSILGVISTSALELGIDIGDLDICILVGYPGSAMATWQRGGRVGRRGRESAVILLGSEDALDQFYMKNPAAFFAKKIESAVLNPYNLTIMQQHLQCAAAEIPIDISEKMMADEQISSAVQGLVSSAELLQSAQGNAFYARRKRPQRNVSLRGSGHVLTIIDGDNGVILGEIDAQRALKECHEGAIYLHNVKMWLVTVLDLLQKEIVVKAIKASHFTRAMSNKNTEILAIHNRKSECGCRMSFGILRVTEKITGYQKRNNSTNKIITTIPLDLPEQTIETEGFWIEIPGSIVSCLEENKMHFMGGLHALEHLMISVFPLLVLCDRNDVGGISCPHHEQTEGATIFIYDGYPGGSGLSKEAYGKAVSLLRQSLEIVSSCDCDNGCPACIHSPKCGSGNRPIDKAACLELLHGIFLNIDKDDGEKKDVIYQPDTSIKKVDVARKRNQECFSHTTPKGIAVLPDYFGVFDLETKYSAEEVGGWHRADKMEMSVAVVYDSILNGYVTYLENETSDLIEHLRKFELIVGFNNKQFDNRVLAPYTSIDLARIPTLDLLEEVSNHLGYRLSLNALAKHTLGSKKGGDGLQALNWYKKGEIEKLLRYCKSDVEITKELLFFALENGYLLFQNKAKKTVRLPLILEKTIQSLIIKRG